MEEFSNKLQFPLIYTTKEKFEGDIEGKQYYFVSQEKFLQMMNKDNLIYYYYLNNDYYGVSKEEIKRISELNKVCLLELDINHAKKINNSGQINAFFIGIYPSNIEVLRERLRLRGTDSIDQINNKLKKAHDDIYEILNSNIFNHKILNDDFLIAYDEFKGVFESIYPQLNDNLDNNLDKLNRLILEYEKQNDRDFI